MIYLPDQDRTIEVDSPIEPVDEDHCVVPIVVRANFSFDGRIATQQTGVLAAGVDVSNWVSGTMLFLVHARNAWSALGGTTALFRITAECARLDAEEPETQFVDESRNVATSTLNQGLAIPLYAVSALAPPFGPQLRIKWTWLQGAAGATAALTCACSIYLVGRRA